MTDQVMEIAAYVALAIGIGLVVYHLAFPYVPRALRVLRFRHRLRRLQGVPTSWSAEQGFRTPSPGDLTLGSHARGELRRRRRRDENQG
jgi:hypothetical protein